MSLNWDITKCENPDELVDEEHWDFTDAMIWATMFTGIGNITEKNWTKFYARCEIGGYFRESVDPLMIKRYIGLNTNVFPEETDQKWLKRIFKYRIAEAEERALRKGRESEQDATASPVLDVPQELHGNGGEG